jgi:hypothetical protein
MTALPRSIVFGTMGREIVSRYDLKPILCTLECYNAGVVKSNKTQREA